MNPVLEFLLENLNDLVFHPHRLVYGYFPKEITRNNLRVTLHRLEKKGFIQKGLVENEICIRLTELGFKELKRQKNKVKWQVKNEKWDGLWRVVVFDIPEENKRVRAVLRQTLKLLGFEQLQKSVWISKRNYTKELREWLGQLKMSQYVYVFETGNLK